MVPCEECGAALAAEAFFCPRCGAYVGTPCRGCDRRLGLRKALCECGAVTPPPAAVLDRMREARSGEPADVLEGLLALEARQVVARLGPPARRRSGLTTPRPADPHMFGPWPGVLAGGRPYEEWVYDRGDQRWLLWLSRRPDGGRLLSRDRAVVVQVTDHPAGAVF